MNNIPKSVRIGPIVYAVELHSDLRDGDMKLNGWIRHNECRILIDDCLHPQRMVEVLWHEVVHAILEQAGRDADESTVLSLAFGIVGALQNNECLRE